MNIAIHLLLRFISLLKPKDAWTKRLRVSRILGCYLLLNAQFAAGSRIDKAEELLRQGVEEVFAILNDKTLSKPERCRGFTNTINLLFDFSLMGRLAIGKKHWVAMDGEEQRAFLKLFKIRIQNSYIEKLSLFTDEEIEFGNSVEVKNKIHVPLILKSKGRNYVTKYKFFNSKEGLKVYDFEVEGVSLISTYRSQYNQVLAKKTIDDLLQIMRDRSDESKSMKDAE